MSGKVVGGLEKASSFFYFSATLKIIHEVIGGDIIVPCKTNLKGPLMLVHARVHVLVII